MSLPAATKLGQGNIFTGVCLSTGAEGCLPQCMLGYTPRTRPPGSRHPPEQTHTPREQTPPSPGSDLPGSRHSPTRPLRSRHPPKQQTPPPGSRLQHTVNERPVRILLECILVFLLFGNPNRSINSFVCNQASGQD